MQVRLGHRRVGEAVIAAAVAEERVDRGGIDGAVHQTALTSVTSGT